MEEKSIFQTSGRLILHVPQFPFRRYLPKYLFKMLFSKEFCSLTVREHVEHPTDETAGPFFGGGFLFICPGCCLISPLFFFLQ